eukprot:1583517-Amphidinium_carterae.1
MSSFALASRKPHTPIKEEHRPRNTCPTRVSKVSRGVGNGRMKYDKLGFAIPIGARGVPWLPTDCSYFARSQGLLVSAKCYPSKPKQGQSGKDGWHRDRFHWHHPRDL